MNSVERSARKRLDLFLDSCEILGCTIGYNHISYQVYVKSGNKSANWRSTFPNGF